MPSGSGSRSRRSRLAPVEDELPLGEVPTTVISRTCQDTGALDEGLRFGVAVAAAAMADPELAESGAEAAGGEGRAVVAAERELARLDPVHGGGAFDDARSLRRREPRDPAPRGRDPGRNRRTRSNGSSPSSLTPSTSPDSAPAAATTTRSTATSKCAIPRSSATKSGRCSTSSNDRNSGQPRLFWPCQTSPSRGGLFPPARLTLRAPLLDARPERRHQVVHFARLLDLRRLANASSFPLCVDRLAEIPLVGVRVPFGASRTSCSAR